MTMILQKIDGHKINIMENYNKEKYDRAKKKVQQVKGFYSHLTAYIIVNLLLTLVNMGIFQNDFFEFGFDYPTWPMITTPLFWGIGLFLHGLYVFQNKFKFLKDWEDRKVKEFMEEEEGEIEQTNNWK